MALWAAQERPELLATLPLKILGPLLNESTVTKKESQDSFLVAGGEAEKVVPPVVDAFQAECQFLLNEAGENADTLRRILAVLKVPNLTGDARSSLRRKAARIMEFATAEKRSPQFVERLASTPSGGIPPPPDVRTIERVLEVLGFESNSLRERLRGEPQRLASQIDNVPLTLDQQRLDELRALDVKLPTRRNRRSGNLQPIVVVATEA